MGSINAEIRAEMGRQRVTYADLARATDQTRQAVQRKLTAERAVSIDDLETYSSALGIAPWKLLESAQRNHSEAEVSR